MNGTSQAKTLDGDERRDLSNYRLKQEKNFYKEFFLKLIALLLFIDGPMKEN